MLAILIASAAVLNFQAVSASTNGELFKNKENC